MDFLEPNLMGTRKFTQSYRCYSTTFGALSDAKSEDVKKGGKILMPPSALDLLTRLNITYPMMFKLTNKKKNNRATHCGVLEFVAEEGVIYIPYWMMGNLLLDEGDTVHIENVTLDVASFVKFQPQTASFLEIANPKAVLENALRNFSCLTKGDVIAIYYNNLEYGLCVKELKPANAVNITECDLDLEIETPIGHEHAKEQPKEEPESMVVGTPNMKEDIEEYLKSNMSFSAFSGAGNRLDGKKKNTKQKKMELDLKSVPRGVPNYKWQFGKVSFIRNNEPLNPNEESAASGFEAFSGEGQVLRKKKEFRR